VKHDAAYYTGISLKLIGKPRDYYTVVTLYDKDVGVTTVSVTVCEEVRFLSGVVRSRHKLMTIILWIRKQTIPVIMDKTEKSPSSKVIHN